MNQALAGEITPAVQPSSESPPEPSILPETRLDYFESSKRKSIGRIYARSDGSWIAISPWEPSSVHTGPMARWDASHALTLAYMRHIR